MNLKTFGTAQAKDIITRVTRQPTEGSPYMLYVCQRISSWNTGKTQNNQQENKQLQTRASN